MKTVVQIVSAFGFREGHIACGFDVEPQIGIAWWDGHGIRSGGHGAGAGWAMKVGKSCPGINTETPFAYRDICICKQVISHNREHKAIAIHGFTNLIIQMLYTCMSTCLT